MPGGPPRGLAADLLRWFDAEGRDLPWRRRRDPYAVLVAELLLQRTRADLVPPVYEAFLAAFPDPAALAEATPERVLDVIRPLGLPARAARLPVLGRELVERHGGRVPRDPASLRALTGVGPYVANAVAAVAYGRRVPLLDPNVIRVLDRVFDRRSARSRPRADRELWAFVAWLLPRRRAADFGLALVDLGALVCRPRPRCDACPLRGRCRAHLLGRVTPQRGRYVVTPPGAAPRNDEGRPAPPLDLRASSGVAP